MGQRVGVRLGAEPRNLWMRPEGPARLRDSLKGFEGGEVGRTLTALGRG